MKIAILITDITTKGGIERVTSNLCNHLTGFEITIISCFKCYSSPAYEIVTDLNIEYLVDNNYDINKPLRRMYLIMVAAYRLKKFLHKNSFDVIISQAFLPTFLLWLIRYKNPIAICEHYKYDLYGKFMTTIRNHIYKGFKNIVTLTDADSQKFREKGIDSTTIPNMISFPIQEHDYIGKRMISIGRLDPQKGYDMLIEALVPVFNQYPDWTLDIYGEGDDREMLEAKINGYKLQNNIALRGYSKNINEELLNSDICLVSSRFEGFPMSIVEALALGTPVVSFDCPEGPGVLLKDDAGILVPPENIPMLSEAIKRMISNISLREMCRKNGYRNIRHYTPIEICKVWKNYLHALQENQIDDTTRNTDN